jgi:hypothetical protein
MRRMIATLASIPMGVLDRLFPMDETSKAAMAYVTNGRTSNGMEK